MGFARLERFGYKKNMKTLIITDVQHDFMPGGALEVPHANEIIPIITALIPHFEHVIATLDWHPANHISFSTTHKKNPGEVVHVHGLEQILWPPHCVQKTHGAHLVNGLDKERIKETFYKGIDRDMDSYSVFFDNIRHRATGLASYLRGKHLKDLYFVGLSTDYCILYSTLDALMLGFTVTVIRDACRGINLYPREDEKALETMRSKGARIALSSEFLQ